MLKVKKMAMALFLCGAPFLAPFDTNDDRFTKTGSGQTYRKTLETEAFLAGCADAEAPTTLTIIMMICTIVIVMALVVWLIPLMVVVALIVSVGIYFQVSATDRSNREVKRMTNRFMAPVVRATSCC